MGTSVPWTVKTTKRKSTTSTPAPRKRRRASLPAGEQGEYRAQRGKQRTLTQIQWIPPRPVSFDDAGLEMFEVETEPKSRSRRTAPALRKQDSTLTQMDFLAGTPSRQTGDENTEPLLVPRHEAAPVPPFDGNYDSPRKPRPSRVPRARNGSDCKRKNVLLLADESQEYVPTIKRRKGKAQADETPVQGRRRSGRHPDKVPSDPAENFAVFQEALADVTPSRFRPTLEIKDSTDLDDDLEHVIQLQQNEVSEALAYSRPEVQISNDNMTDRVEVLPLSPIETVFRTPQKKRRYIPSSQSPESLPPSTKKRDSTSRGRHKTTPGRKPLAELSINTPTRQNLTIINDVPMDKSSSKRRICTLKLPRIPLGSTKTSVEDSQADIWTVQPTSSPKQRVNSQRLSNDVVAAVSIGEEQFEIPSTSQIQDEAAVTSSPPQPREAETQESLMSLNAIFGIRSKEPVDSNDSEPQQALVKSNVEARDFVTHPQQTPQKETQYVRFLQSQPEYGGAADDLGSPVANDTQFAEELARIPTSPLRKIDSPKKLSPHDTIRISSSSPSKGEVFTSPLPVPKLVNRVEYQNSTTTVPLKDLSSPILPPMPPPTHRSIAPASLPHPSQMSTQEPSQQLPQLSSIPQHSPTCAERITIKDSSSLHEYLSQMPDYNEDELQLQRELETTRHNVLEDEDDDANDDLDPRTPRKTIRPEQQSQEVEVLQEHFTNPDSSPSEAAREDSVHNPSPPADFTQNGHVTIARIEDMRKRGLIPPGYNPPAYKVRPARELLPAWMFEDDDDEL